jgi:hypothetical protein
MTYEVFKVVKEEDGKLTSIYMRGPARFEYTLGEETKSETPIFVYIDLRAAHKVAQNNMTFRLLRGTSTTRPVLIMQQTRDILDVAYPYSPAMVKNFWKYNKRDIKSGYTTIPVDYDAYGVYDFTPIEDLPFFYPLYTH